MIPERKLVANCLRKLNRLKATLLVQQVSQHNPHNGPSSTYHRGGYVMS